MKVTDDRVDDQPVTDQAFKAHMAAQFRLAADLLETQDADGFRIRAYHRAAQAIERLDEPASAIYRRDGLAGLIALPAIGRAFALAIADVVDLGRWRWLDRLRGDVDPEVVLATVAGIGEGLAGRLHEELGVESLEELEQAANDGRLEQVVGFGPKRVRSIKESLAGRLGYQGRVGRAAVDDRNEPTVAELLDVDREYREKARRGVLPLIAPRRFNPSGRRWLPILHTTRRDHHLTALYSNTARAHHLGRTSDWVVIYADSPDQGRWTVVTETTGPAKGERVVRGRPKPSPH